MLERSKLSVKEVLSHYLQLEKRGKDYWALCPFHGDNNPSLSISESKNIFKCFSCGIGGDAISFIMRREKTSFREALIKAHQILKLPIDNIINAKTSAENQFKRQLLKFNEFVAEFFEKQLFSEAGKLALNYLTQERKLSLDLIRQMKIGYSPKGNSLLKALERIKDSSADYQFMNFDFLCKTGIFTSDSDNTLIPIFRDRITFSIFSKTGELIGFSSRAMPHSKADIRYLHSKETFLFKKAQFLYNFQSLEKSNDNFIYLFEGFFDLFSLLLLKPSCKALALMGKELSQTCLELLKREGIQKIVLVLDSDIAGISASLKIIQQLLKAGIKPYSMHLDFQKCKDFSELYCSNPDFTLPEPIHFVDWIKANWRKCINQSTLEAELIGLNQIINTLLKALFIRDNHSLHIQPHLEAQFIIEELNKIFSLYEIVNLTEKEKEIISSKHKNYLERINLHFLDNQKKNNYSRNLFLKKNSDQKSNIISNFSSISIIWDTLLQSKKSQEIIQYKLNNWESQSLEDYSELFQWILLPEEKTFLTKLQDNFSKKRSNIQYSEKNESQNFNKLWDFFELYYSLIHLLLDKTENYLKNDNLTNLTIKWDWLKKIEIDRERLHSKSSNIFNKLLKLENK